MPRPRALSSPPRSPSTTPRARRPRARTRWRTRGGAAREGAGAHSGWGVDGERVPAQARLRQTEAELARAQTTVAILGGGGGSTGVLRAPIEGTVISRHTTVGAVAQPGGDPLIEIGNPASLWVVAEVFERELAQVHDN